MKKYIPIFIILLFLCGFNWQEGETLECTADKCPGTFELARMTQGVLGASGGAAAACATTDSTLPHDVAGVHGWETGDPITWTLSDINDPDIITQGADISGYTNGAPAGLCGKGLKIVVPDTLDMADAYVVYDRGAGAIIDLDTVAIDVYFYLYVESLAEINDGCKIASGGAASAPTTQPAFLVNMSNNSGNVQLRAEGVDNSSFATITTGAWHKVKVSLDTAQAAAGSSITIDAGSAATFQRNAVDIRYFFISAYSTLGADEPMTFAIDLFAVDTP